MAGPLFEGCESSRRVQTYSARAACAPTMLSRLTSQPCPWSCSDSVHAGGSDNKLSLCHIRQPLSKRGAQAIVGLNMCYGRPIGLSALDHMSKA